MISKNKFQIGDKVKLLNDNLSGVVIKINNQQVDIQCNEGFVYTFDKREIIKHVDLETTSFIDPSDKAISEKNSNISKKTESKPSNSSKNKTTNNPLEIDLHIHQLVESEKGLSNYKMLSIQLETAKKHVEQAIDKKLRRIVFIHGIGEGVLKNELLKMLKKYPVEVFEASYKKYGQGATEVVIY